MPNIEWYGPEEGGKSSTAWKVSHTTPVVKALKHHSYRIAFKAAWLLDTRADHRTGAAQIRTIHYPQTKLDSYAYLVDPENKRGAQGIENGHWTRGYAKRRDGTLGDAEGPIRNGKHGDGGGSHWVEGLHVLRDAIH